MHDKLIDDLESKLVQLATLSGLEIDRRLMEATLAAFSHDQETLEICLQLVDAEIHNDFFDLDKNLALRAKLLPKLNFSTSKYLSQLLGSIFPARNFPPNESAAVSWDQSSQDCLNNNGFGISPSHLRKSTCERIVKGLADVSFEEKKSGRRHTGYSLENVARTKENTCWAADQQQVLAIPEVQQLASDPNIIAAIGNYLGTDPVHVQASCWWTVNRSNSDSKLSKSAQLFHQDKEFIRFVKVFIYLTDVGLEQGPHCYVEGSFRDYEQKIPQGYKFSDRISDTRIESWYGKERIRTFTAKQGTVLLEDTNGFHKGLPVISGHRLMLQLEYASSLYLSPGRCFGSEGLTKQYHHYLSNNPRFAQNYQDEHYQSCPTHVERPKSIFGRMLAKVRPE
jgi:hypothetical protein